MFESKHFTISEVREDLKAAAWDLLRKPVDSILYMPQESIIFAGILLLPIIIRFLLTDMIDICKKGMREGDESFAINPVKVPEPYHAWGAEGVFYRNLEFIVKSNTKSRG
ncbi:hypothetical protein ACX93W_17935 [Paenibacillus sp. CAU 1782]